MHMVAINGPDMNHHLMSSCRLTQYFPAPRSDVATKNPIAILCHPNQVIFAVPDGVAATLVRFHPATLYWNRGIPGRLKAWGFLMPSRPGEFHPEPLTDSVREPLDSYGSCHHMKAAAFH